MGEGECVVIVAQLKTEVLDRFPHHRPHGPHVTLGGLIATRRRVQECDDVVGGGWWMTDPLRDGRAKLVPGDV